MFGITSLIFLNRALHKIAEKSPIKKCRSSHDNFIIIGITSPDFITTFDTLKNFFLHFFCKNVVLNSHLNIVQERMINKVVYKIICGDELKIFNLSPCAVSIFLYITKINILTSPDMCSSRCKYQFSNFPTLNRLRILYPRNSTCPLSFSLNGSNRKKWHSNHPDF